MGSSSPSTTETTQVSEPWEGSQPFLRDIMGQAQNLNRTQSGSANPGFSTVTPFSDATHTALEGQVSMANGQMGSGGLGAQATAATQGLMTQSTPERSMALSLGAQGAVDPYNAGSRIAGVQSPTGLNDNMVAAAGRNNGAGLFGDELTRENAAQGIVGDIAQSGGIRDDYGRSASANNTSGLFGQNLTRENTAASQAASLANGTGGASSRFVDPASNNNSSGLFGDDLRRDNAASGLANGFATGQQGNVDSAARSVGDMASGGSNPYLDSTFDRAANAVEDRVNANASLSGRYGSYAHQDQLQDGLGDLATQIYGGAYNADQGRRLSAASLISGEGNQNANRQLSGSQLMAGLDEQALGRGVQLDGALLNARESASGRNLSLAGLDQNARITGTQLSGQLDEQGLSRGFQRDQALLAGREGASGRNLSLAGLDQSGRLQGAGLFGQFDEQGLNRGFQQDQALMGAGEAQSGRNLSLAGLDQSSQLANSQFGLNQAQALGQFGLQGNAAALNAVNSAAGIANNDSLAQQRGVALGSVANDLNYDPYSRLQQAGSVYEGQQGAYINDALQRFNREQSAPWENLMRYNSIIQGHGGLGGTSTSVAPSQNQGGGLGGALSGGLSGAAMGSTFGPVGTVVGGGLGVLGGLFN